MLLILVSSKSAENEEKCNSVWKYWYTSVRTSLNKCHVKIVEGLKKDDLNSVAEIVINTNKKLMDDQLSKNLNDTIDFVCEYGRYVYFIFS